MDDYAVNYRCPRCKRHVNADDNWRLGGMALWHAECHETAYNRAVLHYMKRYRIRLRSVMLYIII
jgi:hypothetical protein